jgi:hypothetical protein
VRRDRIRFAAQKAAPNRIANLARRFYGTPRWKRGPET